MHKCIRCIEIAVARDAIDGFVSPGGHWPLGNCGCRDIYYEGVNSSTNVCEIWMIRYVDSVDKFISLLFLVCDIASVNCGCTLQVQ